MMIAGTMDETTKYLGLLGACSKWTDAHRVFAVAIVQGWLLEPTNPPECSRIQLRLLAERYNTRAFLRGNKNAEKRLRRFDDLFIDALPILMSGDTKSYHTALAFDLYDAVIGKRSDGSRQTKGTNYGPLIREILTTGLIVLVMHDSILDGEAHWLGPEKAKERIECCYSRKLPNAMFVMSNKEINLLWRRYRRFAHLAAALLLFVNKQKWTCFRSAQQRRWRREIDQYLSYAQYFQEFLRMFGGKSGGLPKRPGYVRYRYDLVELPAVLGLPSWSPQQGERLTEVLLSSIKKPNFRQRSPSAVDS
jgi:hypothetical protein